jgi:hypothetical protein
MACGAAHADHPLITEDTEVLGAGRWQLELHGQRADDRDAVRKHASATLARGLSERLDLQLDLPWGELGHESGIEDVSLAAKWRFYERGGFSAMFKPELTWPTGREEAGLGAGRTGWNAGVAAAQQWRSFELIAHAGYTAHRNRVGEREALRHASLALLWSATQRLRLLLDYGRETSPDAADREPARSLVYGALYALSDDADLGLGYEQGRSAPADDRVLRAGVKLRW